MAHLINKDAVLAEIDKRIKNLYPKGGQGMVVTKILKDHYEDLLSFIDSMQEEPVNNDFEMALAEMIDKAQTSVVEPWVVAAQWKDELIKLAKSEEPVSEDLCEYINELSKQFPEVSFAKLSRIAVRVAKWQIGKIEEALLSEVLPCFMHGGEADEVVAKLEEVLNKK